MYDFTWVLMGDSLVSKAGFISWILLFLIIGMLIGHYLRIFCDYLERIKGRRN